MRKGEGALRRSFEELHLSGPQRLAILFGDYIPILHVLVISGTFIVPGLAVGYRLCLAVAVLFLLPPVLARCILFLWPICNEYIAPTSRDYFVWWYVLNLQILFCRLTFLEEAMRIVPGLYAAWLRLWGSRVGSFTYWGPGLQIIDRSFLDIGDGVVFGAGVRVVAHLVAANEKGGLQLILSRIRIGHRATIGGYSLLTAGTRIEVDEHTKAFLISPPFSHWKGGKRVSQEVKSSPDDDG